jgi:hypothetical protein
LWDLLDWDLGTGILEIIIGVDDRDKEVRAGFS